MASDRIRGNPKESCVILDTNAILMLFEFSIDIQTELTRLLGTYHLCIPQTVINELHRIAQRGDGKINHYAKAALKLIQSYEIINDEGRGDQAILWAAQHNKAVVVTNDKKLIKELKVIPIKVIALRAKHTLEFI